MNTERQGQRLRVLDINTPWFWFTIFFIPFVYGDSWLKIELWEPHRWARWWFHWWHWEEIPNNCHAYTAEPLTEREQASDAG